jgi:glucokinase
MKSEPYYVGFDLGGTKMMAGVFDHRLKLLATARKKTKAEIGERAGIERMANLIDEALQDAGVDRKCLRGIGVGFPGPLDLNRGVVLQAPNLGWKNVPLRQRLKARFRRPVLVVNDVDAGTFGEYRSGAARGARCVLGIFPGTGVGGAAIYNGQLLRGAVSSCMEIGHLRVQAEGRLCGCGRRGCLETVASRLAIAAEASAAACRGEAPYLLKTVGADLSRMRSGVLREAYDAGDPAVLRIIRHAAEALGIAIADAVNLLAPDLVVLGGGLVEAFSSILLDPCRKRAEEEVMNSFRGRFKIVPARLGDHAVITGAAALAAHPDAAS